LPDKLKYLLSPIHINQMKLRNRVVMPAMETGYGSSDGNVTDRLTQYLARRARGGTGLIITQICAIDPRGRSFSKEIGIWSDDFIPGLKKIPEAVHREGGKVGLQLHHAGRETFAAVVGASPEAPSPIPSKILKQPCEGMTIDRIVEVIEAYGKAAKRAQQAGFDAVEIHGAHGYLVGQFLSPFSNQRTDYYGGSDENRARFAIEIIREVRKQVGPDFPVLIRISAEELIPGGYNLKFMQWLAPQLESAGVDAIHASVGVYSTPGRLDVAVMDTEAGFNLLRARAIKQVVDIPVIGVGRIHDPRLGDDAIARGDADLISFGRQHLADPDFILKARRGDFQDIRYCLACNQGCLDQLFFEGKPITCVINPQCGQEYLIGREKAKKRKLLWVIGAGPAGISAALSALDHGHRVEIFERESEPGGQLRPASRPLNKLAFADWIAWTERQLANRGVKVRCSHEVTEEMIRSKKPEVVILASGAQPMKPDIPGLKGDNVIEARDVLMGVKELKGPAVVLGAGYVGMETADYLLSRGIKVTILEMKTRSPVRKNIGHGYWLYHRIENSGGKIILNALVTRVDLNAVIYRQRSEDHRIEPAATVVTALGASPECALMDILEKLNIPYIVIGDAKCARSLLEAVHEGTEAGSQV
jgi:2,4-dienoyl-CoA reductase-like NADH-dependent reductase (Old Yellow Enzyme family)/thioredoxin reductase